MTGVPPEVERALLALGRDYAERGDVLQALLRCVADGVIDPATGEVLAVVPAALIEEAVRLTLDL